MYEGKVNDREKEGKGTYTFTSGNKYIGEWNLGKPWNIKITDNEGEITGRYVNGLKQK